MNSWLKKIFFILILLIVNVVCFSQLINFPFSDGEDVKYRVYYNWHFVWVYSGNVEFVTSKAKSNGQDLWHFKATGSTFMPYDLIYRVRDTFEVYTTVHPFQPVFSSRTVNHAQMLSHHQYVFDQQNSLAYSSVQRNNKKEERDTLTLEPDTHDLLSTAYYFRSLDFNQFKEGQKIYYRVLVDNDTEDLYFRYLGKEVVKTRNQKKFRCHKLSVQLMKGDFFPDGEYMKVWLTDDQNKIPVQVETEILVGSVKVIVQEMKRFKYPLNSQINE